MWCVSAEIVRWWLGSNTTMSASEPGEIVPLRGYSPNIFAGAVETISTNRLSPIRPACTPWKIRVNRSSTLGRPLGILEKSPLPRSFCPT